MTPETLAALLEEESCPLVLDVRSALEYRSGHIPGARHVPFWRLAAGRIPLPGHDETIILTCEHGPRAQLALVFLRCRGCRHLQLLTGHMHRWRRLRLPLQKGD